MDGMNDKINELDTKINLLLDKLNDLVKVKNQTKKLTKLQIFMI